MNGSVENYNGIQGPKKKNKCTNQSSNDDYNEPRLGFFYNKYASKPKMSLWGWGGGGGSKDEEKLVGARKQTDIL